MPALPGTVLRLVRGAALGVLLFLVLSLVIAIGRPETGPFETVVLVGAVLGLFGIARLAHHMGRVSS